MKNWFYLIALVFVVTSCREDFFSTTLEIDPPEHTPQIATHAFLNYDTKTFYGLVTASESLADFKYEYKSREDANISLITDDGTEEKISNIPYDYEFNFFQQNINSSSSSYTLKVDLPEFEQSTASQAIPTKVPVEDIRFLEDGGIDSDGSDRSAVEIVLDDPAGEENYYEIFVMVDGDDNPGQVSLYTTYASSNDPIADEGFIYGGLLLSDASFDGTRKSLKILIYPTDETEAAEKLWIKVHNVSKEYFQFSKTLDRSFDAGDNPFSTPVQVFTNFDSGLGIFSVFRERIIKI